MTNTVISFSVVENFKVACVDKPKGETKMTIQFSTVQITPTSIQTAKPSIASFVENIERFDNTKGHTYFRVKFAKHDTYAYIVIVEKNPYFAHYCESLEKGLSCKHKPLLAAIADHYGYSINISNNKTKLKDFNVWGSQFDKVAWSDCNDDFNIVLPQSNPTTPAAVPTTPVVSHANVQANREWRNGWKEVQDYLDTEGVDIALQNKLLTRRQRISVNVPIQPNQLAPQKPNFPYKGDSLRRVIRHILRNKHIILIGGKGSGKDTLINTLSWILNIPTLVQVGNKDETKETIVGEPAFRDNQSTYDLSQFSQTVQKGGLVNFAEINFLKGDTTSVFHSLFDENEVLATPIGAIPAHEDFIMCSSMNVGDGYMGVNKLNDAFKDRFSVIRLPQTVDFAELLQSKTGLSDSSAIEFLQEVKKQLEELFYENLAESADTIRGYIDAAGYFIEYGFNHETRIEAVEDFIVNKVEDPDDYFEARAAVREAFSQLHLTDFPMSDEEKAYSASK